ncbi:signal transduction histidine kinase [Kitasatospora gansuensis]|uniref:histidine kinase n=1 Tax=Kitasatospora gansuensis TaxID=258050 RepID=A0A7W7S7T2_9ACTN|nr:ATP-binding protein [Kitasatospora gansuensis]MBB4945272.1 signal transduction histidine kinase [Kitasatospora gansuensis]
MTAREPAPVGRRSLLPAYTVCALTLAAALAWVMVVLASENEELRTFAATFGGVYVLAGTGLVLAGALFATQHPGSGPARLLLAGGCGAVLGQALPATASGLGAAPGPFAVAGWIALAGSGVFQLALYALPLFLPTGSLPRYWGRVYFVLLAVLSLDQAAVNASAYDPWYGSPQPFPVDLLDRAYEQGPFALPDHLWLPFAVTALNLLIMAARWYRTPGPQHLSRVAILVPYLLWSVVSTLSDLAQLSTTVNHLLWYLGAAGWPAGTAYACIRDRSTHLDRSALRALTGLLLATGLIGAYSAAALLFYGLLPADSPGAGLALAALTLVIGVLLRPTARWAVRAVDRYYYGERAEPYQVVRTLTEQLGRAVTPGETPRLLCATVVDTLRLPGARVVTHTREGLLELAALGASGADVAFPMTYQNEVIGHLLVPPRAGGSTLDQQDLDILGTLAEHAAPAIASLRLYEELQASRERIVLAREEARRRLRHDLHDGLGPVLSGLRLRVDSIRAVDAAGGPAEQPLAEVSTGIGQAITELRHITDGLAPAALDQCGLSHALLNLVRQLTGPPRVSAVLSPDPLPPLPAAVEVAAYRICAESLNNAVRHARAGQVRLAVTVSDGRVVAEVSDDGRGFTRRLGADGIGLRSMTERAEELGGRFSLASGPGGTVARAVLPLPNTA